MKWSTSIADYYVACVEAIIVIIITIGEGVQSQTKQPAG